jgi:hypothetical protein
MPVAHVLIKGLPKTAAVMDMGAGAVGPIPMTVPYAPNNPTTIYMGMPDCNTTAPAGPGVMGPSPAGATILVKGMPTGTVTTPVVGALVGIST